MSARRLGPKLLPRNQPHKILERHGRIYSGGAGKIRNRGQILTRLFCDRCNPGYSTLLTLDLTGCFVNRKDE